MIYLIYLLICVGLLLVLNQLYIYFNTRSRSGYFIDERNGRKYKTIKIGEQCWLAENFALDHLEGCIRNYYRKGYIDYLYKWETAKKLCPDGWHLPSIQEWKILLDYLGGYQKAGNKLKSKMDWPWSFSLVKGRSGFNALPAGMYAQSSFNNQKKFAYFWTSTQHDNKGFYAYNCSIVHTHSQVYLENNYSPIEYYYSVRFIKD